MERQIWQRTEGDLQPIAHEHEPAKSLVNELGSRPFAGDSSDDYSPG